MIARTGATTAGPVAEHGALTSAGDMEDMSAAWFEDRAEKIVATTDPDKARELAQQIYLAGRDVQYRKSNLAAVDMGREIEELKARLAGQDEAK